MSNISNKFGISPYDKLLVKHHITRHINHRYILINETTGEIFIKDNAFFPSHKDEETDQAISVNWMEILGDKIDIQLKELGKNPGRDYHKNGKDGLAYFNIGELQISLNRLKEKSFYPEIIYTPTKSITSHSSIKNIPMPSDGDVLLTALNACIFQTVLETFPAHPKAL
jgi:hypothetical protein